MYEVKSKTRIDRESGAKLEGTICHLYGVPIEPLTKDPPNFLQPFFSEGIFPQSWKIPLPVAISSEGGRENGFFTCYAFGYAFVQINSSFQVATGFEQEEAGFLSLIQKMKKESDQVAAKALSWAASRLASAGGLEEKFSEMRAYTLIALQRPGSGLLASTLGFFQRLLQTIPVEEKENGRNGGEVDPVLLTLRSQETIWLEPGRGLITLDPKNLERLEAALFYSLALHHRLQEIEIELERQRQKALSYSTDPDSSRLRSLRVGRLLEEETRRVYRRSLILSDVSRRLTDPKSFIPKGEEANGRIYEAFLERYRFEEREASARDQQKVLQAFFDLSSGRANEVKYFFYGALFKVIIGILLLVGLLLMIFK